MQYQERKKLLSPTRSNETNATKLPKVIVYWFYLLTLKSSDYASLLAFADHLKKEQEDLEKQAEIERKKREQKQKDQQEAERRRLEEQVKRKQQEMQERSQLRRQAEEQRLQSTLSMHFLLLFFSFQKMPLCRLAVQKRLPKPHQYHPMAQSA